MDDQLESVGPVLQWFQDQAWTVLTACDEQEAVMEMECHRPNLIVLDLVLERESGLEVLRHLRELDHHARVVMISQHFDPLLIEQSLRSGAVGFVRKSAGDRLPDGFHELIDGVIDSTAA